jgi:hypothetical protein
VLDSKPGEVDSLLRVLPFAVNGVLVRPVLDDLDPLSSVRLLSAVLGNHEQLADVVLKKTVSILYYLT